MEIVLTRPHRADAIGMAEFAGIWIGLGATLEQAQASPDCPN